MYIYIHICIRFEVLGNVSNDFHEKDELQVFGSRNKSARVPYREEKSSSYAKPLWHTRKHCVQELPKTKITYKNISNDMWFTE